MSKAEALARWVIAKILVDDFQRFGFAFLSVTDIIFMFIFKKIFYGKRNFECKNFYS